jgi:hypothetical protein
MRFQIEAVAFLVALALDLALGCIEGALPNSRLARHLPIAKHRLSQLGSCFAVAAIFTTVWNSVLFLAS